MEAPPSQEPVPDLKNTGLPEWATAPFRDFMNHVELLWQVLHLTIHGISMLPKMPDLVQALADADEAQEKRLESRAGLVQNEAAIARRKELESRTERVRKEAAIAHREVESDFPIVHSQHVVALWSSLEATLHRFVAQWLMNRPKTLLEEPWSDLKVRIGDYETSDREQKAEYVIDALERTLGLGLKQGVNRFESVVAALGLKGSVEDGVKNAIFELQQVRNAIVHRRGLADHRLCTRCPSLRLKPGQQVLVSHEMARKYSEAVDGYAAELVYRCGEFFGVKDIRETARKKRDIGQQA
jgi:hypothetical protein